MKTVKGVTLIGETSTTRPKREHNHLVSTVSKRCTDLLLTSLSSMFDGVDDSFFELANHAHTNNEQNRYFEAMRELRIKRKGIESQFAQAIENSFLHPHALSASADQENRKSQPGFENLSLVQNDALEETVALQSMASKARATFTGSLLQLQTRMTTLYDGASEENPVNPLDPDLICAAFSEACADLAIDIREKLIVFKQFDRYVIGNLTDALEEGNRLLIHAGILPSIKFQTRKSRVHPRSSTDDAVAPDFEEAEDANDGALFQQIQTLLHGIRRADPGASPYFGDRLQARSTSGPVHYLTSTELLNLLSKIPSSQGIAEAPNQANLAEGPAVALNLRESLQGLLDQEGKATGKSSTVEQVDEDLINLVSMLFEFILDDYNLSAPVQVLISRLQIPILKVAIKDRSFFSKPAHPARRLLNALAKAGIGWSDASERKKDRLYDKIHHAVRRILTEFNGSNIELFGELYEDFSKSIEKEEHKARIVEKRTREAEAGRIKSQKAHRIVDEIVRQKLAEREAPEVVRDLLRNGWNRVMFLAYLREDTDHRFRHSVRVVDELIWCLTPHTDPELRQRWVKIVPQLLKQIKAGLTEVSISGSRLDDLIGELKQVLTDTFKAVASGREMPRTEVADTDETIRRALQPPAKAKTAVELQSELESSVLAEFLARIQELDDGCWVEFSLVNGSRFRCKLSGRIEEGDRYIFVNRLGLKVVEKSAEELAHELRKGRLHILEEGLLVDRAMNSVVSNLRKMSGKVA